MREGLMDIVRLKVYDSGANFFTVRLTSGEWRKRVAGGAGNELTASRLRDLLLERGLLIRDLSGIRGLGESYFRVAVKNHGHNMVLPGELKAIVKGQ